LRYSHIKLGGGNFSNALAEATYNTKRNKNQALAAFARYHSGRGPVENSDFSEQILRLQGKQLFDKATLKATPFVRRNRIHRYGYESDSSFGASDVRQDYLRYGLQASFHNKRSDSSATSYVANVDLQNLQTPNQVGETDLQVGGHLMENLNNNAARIDAEYRFLDYRTSNGSFQRNVIKFGGRYIFRNLNNAQVELGFRTASMVDTTENSFHFYPNIKLTYELIPDTLTFFGGIKGDLKPNTYGELTRQNPYLRPNVNLRNTNEQFNLFAGLKGHLGNKFDYLMRLAFLNVENMPLYVNSRRFDRRFQLRYDTAISTILRLHTELRFQPVNHFQLGLKLGFRNFNMGQELEPWHRPTLDYQVNARYNFGKKVRLRASIQGYGQRKALSYNNNPGSGNVSSSKNLDAILDINTGVDYRFSKTFTAFFNFRNLLGTEYQYWNQYPVRGFHVTGGLKVNLFE
jgi:hypothetical protein